MSELEGSGKLYCERTQVATRHELVADALSFVLRDEFGSGNATLGTRLVKEVNDSAAQRKHFIGLPIYTTEGFPMAIEIVGFVDVCISLSKVAERSPHLEVGRNHVAGVYFYKYLGHFCHDVARSVDFSFVSVVERNGRFVLLVGRLLISEEEVEVEATASVVHPHVWMS